MEEFRELNVGLLEDAPAAPQSWARFKAVVSDWMAGKAATRFPDGENYDELVARISSGIAQVVRGKSGKKIIIVGHGGIFSYPMARICENIELADLVGTVTLNCSIREIEAGVVDGVLRARLTNWAGCDHISGDAA